MSFLSALDNSFSVLSTRTPKRFTLFDGGKKYRLEDRLRARRGNTRAVLLVCLMHKITCIYIFKKQKQTK